MNKNKHSGRGRPKGSKNKVKKAEKTGYSKNGKRLGRPPKDKKNEPPKKMGRPKKVYPMSDIAMEEERLRDLHPVITHRYEALGFCPKCKLSLGSGDLVKGKKFIVECPKCGNVTRKKNLLEEIDLGERAKTKKEYLQTVNSVYSTWRDHVSHGAGCGGEPTGSTKEPVEEAIDLNELPSSELPDVAPGPEDASSTIPFDRDNPDTGIDLGDLIPPKDDDEIPPKDEDDIAPKDEEEIPPLQS